MESAMKLYCYSEQSNAVMDIVRTLQLSPVAIHAVHEADQLRGLEDIAFLMVKAHPNKLPEGMARVLTEQGCIAIELTDLRRRRTGQ
jgi:hypothetical protein